MGLCQVNLRSVCGICSARKIHTERYPCQTRRLFPQHAPLHICKSVPILFYISAMRLSRYQYIVVRVRCLGCERQGRTGSSGWWSNTATAQELLHHLTVDCGWRWEKKWNVFSECKAFYPDLVTPPRPSDLPAGMRPLRLIKGGKSQEEPAQAVAEPKKRRST